MPLSGSERARQRQLGNLKRGGTVAPAGNQRAVKHGAYALVTEAELESHPKALAVYEALAADAPVRARDGGLPSHDGLVVRMLAENRVQRERVRVDELLHGIETSDGRLRGVVEYGLRLDAQALDYTKELGMTPASRMKLGLNLAKTHRTLEDDVAAAGRAAWERRQAIDGTVSDGGRGGEAA